jgi:hypothetical protein
MPMFGGPVKVKGVVVLGVCFVLRMSCLDGWTPLLELRWLITLPQQLAPLPSKKQYVQQPPQQQPP